MMDEIDERAAVPGLDQPFLRRLLALEARLLECLEGAIDVRGPDHEVEIVARLRSPASPARQAAAQQERDIGAAQRGGGLLQRVLEIGERLLVIRGHM